MEISGAERRLEHLEERFQRSEEKIAQLDKSNAVYSVIFERNLLTQEKLSASIDKLSETTVGLQNTLIGVQKDIKLNYEAQESNSKRISAIESITNSKIIDLEAKLHEKLEKFEDDLNNVDNKGKFDFIKFIKENFLSVILVIYMILDGLKNYISIKAGGG